MASSLFLGDVPKNAVPSRQGMSPQFFLPSPALAPACLLSLLPLVLDLSFQGLDGGERNPALLPPKEVLPRGRWCSVVGSCRLWGPPSRALPPAAGELLLGVPRRSVPSTITAPPALPLRWHLADPTHLGAHTGPRLLQSAGRQLCAGLSPLPGLFPKSLSGQLSFAKVQRQLRPWSPPGPLLPGPLELSR